MENRNAKEEVKINKFELDDALEEQPDLYLDWALEHAEAVKEKDAAKGALEKVKSELGIEIRKDPKKYGLDKPTGQAVEDAVIAHATYQEAYETFVGANREANRLSAIREAFDQRRSSLKYLTELWTQNYYGAKVGEVDKYSKGKIDKAQSEEQRKGIEGTMGRRSRR